MSLNFFRKIFNLDLTIGKIFNLDLTKKASGKDRLRKLELLNLESRITPATITVTTLSDLSGHTGVSLRDAITTANGTIANDNIVFDSSLFTGGPGVITLSGSALPTIANNGSLSIAGPGSATLTINGDDGNASRNFNIFNIGSSADFTVSGVTISGVKTTGNGGAFNSNAGILTVADAVITNNYANDGAGIYGNSGTLTVSNTSITGNTSTSNGGGIFNFGRYGNSGPVKITNTTISGNKANNGAGISNTAPSITITGSTITGNTATTNGGGINNDGRYGNAGPMTITNTTISGNNATTGLGGGINTVGVITITGSTIANNNAGNSGGGIRNDSRYGVTSPTFTIDNTSILNNTSKGSGGAISNGGPLTINNSNISGNSATNNGGGIQNDSRYGNSGTFTVTNTTISKNFTSSSGGGVFTAGPLAFSNTTISGNAANSNGGGIWNDSRYGNGGTQTLTNVTIASNSANSGGAFYNVGGTVSIFNSILADSTKGDDFTGSQPTNSSNNIITSGTMNGSTKVTSAQLNLGLLQNNGGSTPTMALGAGSAAIGAGKATISNASPVNGLDQRGYNRTTPDVGAFAAGIAVTTTADTVDATDNLTSLREAITLANTTRGNDNISFLFPTGSAPYTITLSSALPAIVSANTVVGAGTAGTLNINGLGASNLIIDGNKGNFSIFSIDAGGNLSISGVTVTKANSSGNGGAFNNQGTLAISSSTLSSNTGNDGAAIRNDGTLTVSNAEFSNNGANNRAGAIYNTGTATVTSSSFNTNTSGNQGGAIFNDGTLTISLSGFSANSTGNNGGAICQFSGSSVLSITDSTFSGNISNDGGAIRSDGTLTLSNSTLTSNVATNNGGGLFNLGTAKITNSTFYGNTANSLGGAIRTGGIIELSSSTFSANSAGTGGAIQNFDYTPTVNTSLKIANTIIANSTNGGDYVGDGAVGLLGSATAANNLITQGSFSWATTKTSAEINLGALKNNGGPTFTMAVVDGSAAVSTGNPAVSNAAPVNGLDQRGVQRSSTTPTIGAYEFVPVYPSVTQSTVALAPNSPTININGSGFSTTPNKNTVTFSNGAVGTVTAATATQLTVTFTTQPTSIGNLTAIVFTSGISYTVSSGAAVQVATVPAVVTVTTLADTINANDNVLSLREAITAANATSSSEFIVFDSSLFTGGPGVITLAGSALPTIANNGLLGIAGPGSATLTISGDNGNLSRNFNIFNIGSSADFTVSGVTISGAKTTGNGGALNSNAGILTVTDAIITNNFANDGAGIYGNSGTLTVSNTSITGNTSTGNGGGIFNFGRYGNSGPVKITNTTISGNKANNGAGISNSAPSITITGSTITGNIATNHGGGINNDGRYGIAGPMTITNTTISGNTATNGVGGGINSNGTMTISTSTISGNTANNNGGGIHNDSRYGGTFAFTISDSKITNNSTKNVGGGINTAGNSTITNATISGNSATNQGGGINSNGTLTISTSTISGNTSNSSGGAINNSGTLNLTNSTISGNKANSQGGGINSGGTLTVSNSIISNNTANDNGGGINNSGNITISNSTISGNKANTQGGGIRNDSRYGGNFLFTVTNSTISGNSAGSEGGGVRNGGPLAFSNTTISGNSSGTNGGGIWNDSRYGNGGTQTLTNVTIAANSANSGGAFYNNGGTVNIYNSILADSTKGDDFGGTQPTNSSDNIITSGTMNGSTTVTSAQLNLGQLQNNGGTTSTIALGAGSAAIGAGKATISNASPVNGLDQRGYNRTTPDVGAFSAGIAVTTTADTVDATDNLTSLREAITLANTTPGNDNISFLFPSGSAPYTITLSSALPAIVSASTVVGAGTAGTLNINGLGASNLKIDGNKGNFSIFSIASGGNLSISGVTVTGANSSGNGGAFNNQGILSISSSTLSSNTAIDGAAIFNNGTLSVTSSTISGNTASNGGAISNSGTLSVTSSTLSGNTASNGGAISNSGTLSVTSSTLSSNTAVGGFGGGIFNLGGNLTVSNSTISDNTSFNGGAILNTGAGTGTVFNSTFSGNSATTNGGAIFNDTTLTVTSSTLSGNSATSGGGIFNDNNGTLNIANTIIANSTSGGDFAGSGTVKLTSPSTATNNLVTQGSFAWATTKTSSEINLGALKNNGGPTFTMAVVDGSAAVSTGSASVSNASPVNGLDQRGVQRSSTTPTIGAYEFVPVYPSVTQSTVALAPNSPTININGSGFSTTPNKNTVTFSNGAVGTVTAATATQLTVTFTTQPTSIGNLTAIVFTSGISYTVSSGAAVQVATVPLVVTVTTLADTINANDNVLSLREAITAANATSASEFIVFDSSLFTGGPKVITLAGSALPTIANNGLLGIAGPGSATLTISGDNGNLSRNFNIFNIGSSADFTVSGVTISGAKTTGNGGALNSSFGLLTVTDAVITNNYANDGAGIYGRYGALTVSNSSITGNTSTGNGGGIFNFGRYYNSGAVKITNTIISGNKANNGAGISNTAPSITITGSTITGNTAINNGGGISNDGTGGIAGPMTITNTTISGNTATNGVGGGINSNGTLTISTSTISGNTSNNSGGGIHNDSRYGGTFSFTISDSQITNNSSKADGGGINNAGNITISNTTISGNTATNQGGGVRNDSRYGGNFLFTVTNSTISGNSAGSEGGGVRNGGPLAFTNTTISGNSSGTNGGGIWNDSRYGNGGTQTLTNVTIASNSANSGGAFYNVGGKVNIYNSILADSTKGVDFTGTQPTNSSDNIITSGTMNGSTKVTSAQLNLGKLQNNGGPTPTIALGAGSTAIGTGNATISNASPVNALDQRGVARSSTTPSIGAFEYIPPIASQLGLTTNAAGSVNGLAFTTQPVITLQDSIGATAGTNNSPVTMTVSNGATTLGTTTVNAVNGVATFTNVGITGTIGTSYTLTFASNGLTSATQSITILIAAIDPAFGAPTATADGFTVQITNYDANFTYGGTATANGTVAISNTGLVTVSGVAANTSSTATITTAQTNYANGSAPVTATSLLAANTPSFGAITATSDGFTVQITNYNGTFTYGGTVTVGSVTIGGSGLVTVTGVAANTSSTATITTTKTGYANGSAPVTANSLITANTPTFGTPTGTADGFTVQITNHNGAFTYGGTATVGSVSIGGSGLVTVTGVAANTSSTVTITTAQTGYANGSAPVNATSLLAANTPTFGAPTATADGFTVQINNYNGAFTYGGTATANGSVAISNTGLVTVSGVAANTSSTATITTAQTNYANGSAPVTATSLLAANTPTFGATTATPDGFTVQITNYNGSFTYGGTVTVGSVTIGGSGLVTVTGVAANTSSTATITTTKTGYANGSAPVTATSLITANTPTFGAPTGTADGFTVQITNHNVAFTYGGTATVGSVSIGGSGLVTVTGLSPNTSSTVTITTAQTGYANGSAPVNATSLLAANTPAFGAPIATADGFTVQISNYDANFTYAGTATAGSASIDGSGLVTITGVSPNTSSTATITTTQTGYANGSAPVTATSLLAANTPAFDTPTPTADGFTVQITNYNGAFNYGGTATANGTVAISTTGLVTVSGVSPNTSSTATITTTQTGYGNGSAQISATGLNAANTPAFATATPTADGFTVQITNYDANFTYGGTATVGSVSIDGSGLVTVTGLSPNTSSTATITTTQTGYANGSAPVTTTSLLAANTPAFDTATPTPDGYTVQITNYNGAFTYGGTATAGSVSISGTGFVTVTGVSPNTSSTVTITTTQTGFANGSAPVVATSLLAANTPAFDTATPTPDGYTVQITNYNGAFTYSGTATAGSVSIDGFGLVTVTGLQPNTSSTATITTTQTGFANGSAPVAATSLAPIAPLVTSTPTTSSTSQSTTVTLYDPVTNEPTGSVAPFPGFTGTISVTSGDFNHDGVADIIAGAGLGGGPAIAVINSQTGEVMESFFAFDPAFTGGVNVAVYDVNNDGILDIIAAAGAGGGPEVRIFNGDGLTILRSFYAYAEDFTGGVSVATIDLNNDGILDIVTGAGAGGAPHVKVFDGSTNEILSQWFAYPISFTGGVFVAVGDISNDGNIELVTGAGQGGAPVVAVWDPLTGTLLAQFYAYAEDFTGGARVGVYDGNGDGILDLITGAGPGGAPEVKGFNFPELDLLFAFYSGDPSNTGGVYLS